MASAASIRANCRKVSYPSPPMTPAKPHHCDVHRPELRVRPPSSHPPIVPSLTRQRNSDHIKELNNQRPKQPFFFLKPPTSILLPDGGPVLRPRGVTMHYEVELGLVMGKTVRDMHVEDKGWMDAIDSYILAIDMTARNVQEEAKRKGLPWSIAKGFDTFLPISSPISKTQLPDPHNAHLWLSVNDQIKQADSTELMLFRIPQQLSEISKVMTLEAGDIVLTGTPKGLGLWGRGM
ncbi:hypothetical protein H2199_001435 [Coniosporium tulheliwenetii]|uniref:Uncharacterized protein n=1 Tax=Coniosporium tulheliwenetii TaxID=3383036 RepID=A0ACC2ZM54_9PEZI|nr:hypothetical protein H2199_001435 [Cladosporium sp. JES 115]